VRNHAGELKLGRRPQPILNWQDLAGSLLLVTVGVLPAIGAHQMVRPFVTTHQAAISLSPLALPAPPIACGGCDMQRLVTIVDVLES
jgi:hypothetical protein